MKIGIIRETKIPHDYRVPLTPIHCRRITDRYPEVSFLVQPDKSRCYSDEEYRNLEIVLSEDMDECDILMGIKEVSLDRLISGKTYLFFSHTAKKQFHNRELLREILRKKIRLIDYEFLTKNDLRVVAFGRYAGIVGAYNALRGYGKMSGYYELKPAWQCFDKADMFKNLREVVISRLKIVITGGGRVAHGAMETLISAGIRQINPDQFLANEFNYPVFTQLDPVYYVQRIDKRKFDLDHFFHFPQEYESIFLPYTTVADLYLVCHYWDPRSPRMLTTEDYRNKDFRIRLIADISCDINGSVPSTLRASNIQDPFYGYDPLTGKESLLFSQGSITIMAVDNLPGELPRDSSYEFGDQLESEVIPALIGKSGQDIIKNAVIAENGFLTDRFRYLEDFVSNSGGEN